MGFLKSHEINQIKKDFTNILTSPEAQTVTIKWQTGHTGTWKANYKRYIGGEPTHSTEEAKCLVKIVRETDIDLLSAGSLKVGNALFYFLPDLDFTTKKDAHDVSNLEIIYRGTSYYPIVPTPSDIDLLAVPLGTAQVAQVLVGSRVKQG